MKINLYQYRSTKDLIIKGVSFPKDYIFIFEENEYKQINSEIKKYLKIFIPEPNKEEIKIKFRFII